MHLPSASEDLKRERERTPHTLDTPGARTERIDTPRAAVLRQDEHQSEGGGIEEYRLTPPP